MKINKRKVKNRKMKVWKMKRKKRVWEKNRKMMRLKMT